MACHLDGGICPHDYPMGKGGSYPVFGSSSYGGGSSYATLGAYNGQSTGAYNGAGQSAVQYSALSNPIGLAAYAADMNYNGAYKSAGSYVPQSVSQKSVRKNARPAFENYRGNDRSIDESNSRNNGEIEQDVPPLLRQPRDVARPSSTIDDTVAPNAVAVQRDFLEQMIRNARSQTVAQQPQYLAMYQ
ncbi:hypothetical protein HZC31_07335 [Candidatus Woesearchaeota archaeon]|nr:hypothetical protein [Candidatus Woesearchaeota archaeon]